MIDKIISLKNGLECYVLDEVTHNHKRFILAAECSKEKEEITDNYMILEVKFDGELLKVDKVTDEDLVKHLMHDFMQRLSK